MDFEETSETSRRILDVPSIKRCRLRTKNDLRTHGRSESERSDKKSNYKSNTNYVRTWITMCSLPPCQRRLTKLITHFLKYYAGLRCDDGLFMTWNRSNSLETRPVTDLSGTFSRTIYELTPTNFARTYFDQNSIQQLGNTEDLMTENELTTKLFLNASDQPTLRLSPRLVRTENWFRFIY